MSKSKKIFLNRVMLAAVTAGFFLFLNFNYNKSDNIINDIEMILESATEYQTEPAAATQETTTEIEIISEPETEEATI